MKIREIREEDLEKVANLAFHAQEREATYDPILRLSEEAPHFIHSWLEESIEMGGEILVAEHEDKIIGFIWGWIVQKPFEIFKVENIGYIYQVYAEEQLSNINLNLKEKLLEAIMQIFKEKGIRYVLADCYVKDNENLELYRKYGFKSRALTLMKELEDK